MAIKNSGNPLSFSEIEAEFGPNPTRSLGKYRTTSPTFNNGNKGPSDGLNGSSLASNLPLDTGIPTSGAIKFSQFYGKRANIVVDLYSGSHNNNYNYDVYNDAYAANKYQVVGNTDRNSISKSQWQGGKKVIIHINKQFRSSGANSVNH